MTNDSSRVLIALGSSIEPRLFYIEEATRLILKSDFCSKLLEKAPIYRSKPIGVAKNFFLNSTITVEARGKPLDWLKDLQNIEESLQRQRNRRWDDRTIDLDIITAKTANNEEIILDLENLCLPHPQAKLRDFVLVPANDIASNWNIDSIEIREHLAKCEMKSIFREM